ncbi:MAG TPA: phosphotransferase [bacterium]|nr:phosphotransferase [bacterium]
MSVVSESKGPSVEWTDADPCRQTNSCAVARVKDAPASPFGSVYRQGSEIGSRLWAAVRPGMESLFRSARNPANWIGAVEDKIKAEDYIGARNLLKETDELFNDGTAFYVGDVYDFVRYGPVSDPVLGPKIFDLKAQIEAGEAGLEARLEKKVEEGEAQTIIATGKKLAQALARRKRDEEALKAFQDLDNLTSITIDVSDTFSSLKSRLKQGEAGAKEAEAFLEKLEPLLRGNGAAPMFRCRELIGSAREEIASGRDPLQAIQGLEAGLVPLLDGPKIRHADLTGLIRDAKSKIASGALQGNDRLYEEGLSDLRSLQRYAEAEGRKEAAFEAYLSLWPENTDLVFVADLYADDVYRGRGRPYEARFDLIKRLDVTRTIDALDPEISRPTWSRFGKSPVAEDAELASKVKAQWEDMRRTAIWRTDPNGWGETFGGFGTDRSNRPNFRFYNPEYRNGIVTYREPVPGGIGELDALSTRLEGLYADPSMPTENFLAKVEETRRAGASALDENEGYRGRIELEEGLKALSTDVALIKAVEAWRSGGGEVPVEAMEKIRVLCAARARVLDEYLQGMPDDPSLYYEMKYIAEGSAWLNSFRITEDTDPATIQSLLPSFEFMIELEFSVEELRVLGGLKEEAGAVSEIPAEKGNERADVSRTQATLDQVTVLRPGRANAIEVGRRSMIQEMEARAAFYGPVAEDLDRIAFEKTLDAKIQTFREMGKEVRRSKGIKNFMSSRDPGPDRHRGMELKYEKIREMWHSEDPVLRKRAREAFIALEHAEINIDLEKEYKGAAKFNQYTIGVGIILASAVTAGVAEGLAVPLLGLADEGLGATAVNAFFFTLSYRAYDSAARGDGFVNGLAGAVKDPVAFAEEFAFNLAMMRFLGKAMKTYEGLFVSRLGRGLIYKAGGFAWEAGAFQVWSAFHSNAQMLLHGNYDPSHALDAFSPSAFEDGFLFLAALKIGGVLSMPLAGTSGLVGGWAERLVPERTQLRMQEEINGVVQALDDYATKGKGDLPELMDRMERALLRQKEFMKGLPEGVRNEATYARNAQALANLRQFRAAYQTSVLAKAGLEPHENPLGLRAAKEGDFLTYPAEKGLDLVRALKKDTAVKWVKVHRNGLVEARVTDPFGRDVTVRLASDVPKDVIKAMKEAVAGPGVPYADYDVIPGTQVSDVAARRASQGEPAVLASVFGPLVDFLKSRDVGETPEQPAEMPLERVYGPHYDYEPGFYASLPADGRKVDGAWFFPGLKLEGKSFAMIEGGEVTFTGRVFGQGSASTVYEAEWRTPDGEQRLVAVKIRDHALDPLLAEKAASREIDALVKIPSELAPNYYGTTIVEGMTAIVTDVVPGQFFRDVDPVRINENTVADIHAIFDGLEGEGWSPGDFQVNIDAMGRARLIDFEGLDVGPNGTSTTRWDVFRSLADLRRQAGLPTDFLDREIASEPDQNVGPALVKRPSGPASLQDLRLNEGETQRIGDLEFTLADGEVWVRGVEGGEGVVVRGTGDESGAWIPVGEGDTLLVNGRHYARVLGEFRTVTPAPDNAPVLAHGENGVILDNGDGNLTKVGGSVERNKQLDAEQYALAIIQFHGLDIAPPLVGRPHPSELIIGKLKGKSLDRLSPREREQIKPEHWKGLEDGLKSLQDLGIHHNDISAGNIIWDGQKLRLVDFGLARFGFRTSDDFNRLQRIKDAFDKGEAGQALYPLPNVNDIENQARIPVADVPFSRPEDRAPDTGYRKAARQTVEGNDHVGPPSEPEKK